MTTRSPAVAGRFYEAAPDECSRHIEQLLPDAGDLTDLPANILAGVVPHAGWVFSGDLAARVFAAIAAAQSVDTFVFFGAVHAVHTNTALLYDKGAWQTPLGTVAIDEPLAAEIAHHAGPLLRCDCDAHAHEHSIEVQVPIIQYLFEQIKIVPIMTPPTDNASELGRAVARAIKAAKSNAVCIASTDLTHYGPAYDTTHMGTGPAALQWAKDTNDKFFLDLALDLRDDQLVPTANAYHNACGAGAVAAAIAAAKERGAKTGTLLGHTTSAQIMTEKFHQSAEDAVGYAAILYH